MKKILSFALSFVIVLGLFLSLAAAAGVSLASAGYTSELWIIAGSPYALVNGTRKEINPSVPSASPYLFMGDTMTMYIPISALCLYTGAAYTVSDKTVTVKQSGKSDATLTIGELTWSGGTFLLPPVLKDGEVYLSNLSVKSVFGVSSFTNTDIGLAVYSTSSLSYSSTYSGLSTLISNLRFLLFDNPTGDQVYADVAAHVGIDTHPRLLVTEERFGELKKLYETYKDEEKTDGMTESEAALASWIDSYVANADKIFNTYFTDDPLYADETGIAWQSFEAIMSLRQPYYLYEANDYYGEHPLIGKTEYGDALKKVTLEDVYGQKNLYGDGYDEGGRGNANSITDKLPYLAFAWQITGESRYVEAYYRICKMLGNWVHWGEGHFLNCADGCQSYALAYDWIYHAFDNAPEKRKEVAKVMYDKAVNIAYYAITDKNNTQGHLHPSTTMGKNWGLTGYTNNWMTVCASGITMGALALLDDPDYVANSKYVIGQLLPNIYKCLLQYAPDGAYIESPGYWAYGTNTYIRMIGCLVSAAGDDYGFLDTVGLQKSYYFMYGVGDDELVTWNYHDGGRSRIDGSYYSLAAALYDDPTIAAYRHRMLFDLSGFGVSFADIFYFDPYAKVEEIDPPLDYNFLGIDTATMHSSWGEDATFTGLHVGANSVSHGCIDSGTFYLEMGGVLWFGDSGAENYNIATGNGYFQTGIRYRLYRKTLESHNTIVIRSERDNSSYFINANGYKFYTGQVFNSRSGSYARINTFHSDENGAYAISDMRPQYGSVATSAKRGLLFTNSRTTVVVQDEITFSKPTDLTWLASSNFIQKISDDNKTALLYTYYNGKTVYLRASLLSDDPDLGFSVITPSMPNVLPDTITLNSETNKKGTGYLYDRASAAQSRLAIVADGVTSFNCAVAFELMRDEREVVGYEWCDMDEWATSTDEWVKEANKDIDYTGNNGHAYSLADVKKAISLMKNAKDDAALAKAVFATLPILSDVDMENAAVVKAVADYEAQLAVYNEKVQAANAVFTGMFSRAGFFDPLAGK